MGPLATVAALAARVGEPIEGEQDIVLADAVLAEASALVRHHADEAWPDGSVVPAVAVAITVAAAARAYLNPSGFQMERGDAVTFNRTDDYAAGAALTRAEINILKSLSRLGNVNSLPLSNPDTMRPRSSRVGRDWDPCHVDDRPYPAGWGW